MCKISDNVWEPVESCQKEQTVCIFRKGLQLVPLLFFIRVKSSVCVQDNSLKPAPYTLPLSLAQSRRYNIRLWYMAYRKLCVILLVYKKVIHKHHIHERFVRAKLNNRQINPAGLWLMRNKCQWFQRLHFREKKTA